MTFNQRATELLQMPVSPLTWDSILKECDRLEAEFLYIPSGYKWSLDYKRFQVEQARGNKSVGLAYLKSAIATTPYNSDIIGDYKECVKKAAGIKNMVLLLSSKKTEARALRLAAQFDSANIEYMIVSGSDAPSIKHIRALQVDAPDSYEGAPRKVAAALTWFYENVGNNVGVMKVDDSMVLREPEKLRQSMLALGQENAYAGVRSANLDHDRCQHWGQCNDHVLNRRVYGRPVLRPWANGGAYFLGAAPIEKIVMALIRFPGLFEGEYYEDKLMGDILVFEGVEPKFINSYADFGLAVGV